MDKISNLIDRIESLHDLRKYDLAIDIFKGNTTLMDNCFGMDFKEILVSFCRTISDEWKSKVQLV